MSAPTLERQVFTVSRAAEYFDASELEKLTGQPRRGFAAVVLKELLDNALDAAETAGKPPQLEVTVSRSEGLLTLAITDNGPGMSAELVQRILDFNTRTSDKKVYKTPTRGAQGNALKTILGLPFALGAKAPVVIEANGQRHAVFAHVDPAGIIRTDHNATPSSRTTGSRLEVTLPDEGLQLDATRWARAFSLFNPHATVRISDSGEPSEHANSAGRISDSYRSSVTFPTLWRKFLPTDLPSAWWFSLSDLETLIFAHVARARESGANPTLRDFVRQFKGLAGTAKAKAVTGRLSGINRISDFEHAPHLIEDLRQAMLEAAPAPSANVLGLVGPDHFRRCFAEWYGVKRYWYKKTTEVIDGLPFAFEVAIAETVEPGHTYHALNFSPTFDDPLKRVHLEADKIETQGALNFLRQGRALSSWDCDASTAVAYHLVSPALTMLDRGKSNVDVTLEQSEKIAAALWKACKDLHADFKRVERDAAKAERRDEQRYREHRREEFKLTEAVVEVLPEAYQAATDAGVYLVSARDLYYVVREKIQAYTSRSLEFGYFSQNLLVDYQLNYGPLPLLYYKPRGILYEPHTKRETPLGTREVQAYDFPAWVYNKILYVEKDGVGEGLKPLAERYDMAIISAEGYASEAARILFSQADKEQNYQLFVLHDADPYGYNIARTLAEETRRMPGYSVEVIGLGFKLEEALEMGLPTETFVRKTALPRSLKLTETERKHFEGRRSGHKSWICERVELNALRPSQRLEYVEAKLNEHGATAKVIPPASVVTKAAEAEATAASRDTIREHLEDLLNFDALASTLASRLLQETVRGITPDTIAEALERERGRPWGHAVAAPLREALRTEAARQAINTAIAEALEVQA
jgi:DNA topoisomerase VI subunit B